MSDTTPVWQRCWCYRIGRCLTDCPTADIPRPSPFTDTAWREAYADALERHTTNDITTKETS